MNFIFQDGVLSVNNKVIGNLTEVQEKELKKYINRTEEWSNQLHQRIQNVKSLFDGVLAFSYRK